MKVFITKYALTEGIQEVDAEECHEPSMLRYRSGGMTQHVHGEGREWHRTLENAIARACDIRIRKIASLEKQIEKLRKLEFKK